MAKIDPDGHDFLIDTSSYEIGSLTDPTLTLADPAIGSAKKIMFDATNDLTFSSVPSGHAAEGVIIYKDTGVASTSTLIAWCKFSNPVATDGSDITVAFNSEGVFELVFDASRPQSIQSQVRWAPARGEEAGPQGEEVLLRGLRSRTPPGHSHPSGC